MDLVVSLLFHRLLLLVAVVGRALQRFNVSRKLHNNIKSNKDSSRSRVLLNNNVNNIMLHSVNLLMSMDDWYVRLQQEIEEAVILLTQEEIHEVMNQGEEEVGVIDTAVVEEEVIDVALTILSITRETHIEHHYQLNRVLYTLY